MKLIICQTQFDGEDPLSPSYSLHEVDYYGHVPYGKTAPEKNHRLSLRKNLRNGQFEIYRHYHWTQTDEVAYTGSLPEAIAYANYEVKRFWGQDREPDQVCQHKEPVKARWCNA